MLLALTGLGRHGILWSHKVGPPGPISPWSCLGAQSSCTELGRIASGLTEPSGSRFALTTADSFYFWLVKQSSWCLCISLWGIITNLGRVEGSWHWFVEMRYESCWVLRQVGILVPSSGVSDDQLLILGSGGKGYLMIISRTWAFTLFPQKQSIVARSGPAPSLTWTSIIHSPNIYWVPALCQGLC